MSGLFALAMLATGAAIWFIGLQAIELQSFCFYCLTVHSCGLIVGVLTLRLFTGSHGDSEEYRQRRSLLGIAPAAETTEDMAEMTERNRAKHLLAAISFSAVGLAALMGGQLLSETTRAMPMQEIQLLTLETPEDLATEDVPIATDQPADGEEGESLPQPATFPQQLPSTPTSLPGPRQIKFQSLPNLVDVNAFPVVGNSEAPHMMLEMMDYTCAHCRELHPHLQATLQRYGDQLGILVHHAPLSKKCNPQVPIDHPGKKNACEYAQLAMGVWKLGPEKFPQFHDWLLEGDKPPSITQARSKAYRLVGDRVLLDKKAKADTAKQLGRQASLFNRFKSSLPILFMKNSTLRGVPKKTQKLFDHLESKLGIEPRQTAE